MSKTGDLNKKEFIDHLTKHEEHLQLVFSSIDENQDGEHFPTLLSVFSSEEIRQSRPSSNISPSKTGKVGATDNSRTNVSGLSLTNRS